MATLNFLPLDLPPHARELRREVRTFLQTEWKHRTPVERARSWNVFDSDFSRKLGARGWIGMTWPRQYGGHERGALERYVVQEELLAAGAPVGAHWIADRQTGALLLRYGTEAQKEEFLPGIARGEVYFCIGMSEPSAGSDLAAIRTRATRVEGGWRVNGSKIWTTNADKAHFMMALVRTGGDTASRHKGLSQLILDLKSPGISIRPITDLAGEQHFNEVFFEDVFVSDARLVGAAGDGWRQVTAELSLERSGPERYLSSQPLLEAFVHVVAGQRDEAAKHTIGRLIAELWTLRQMSMSIAGQLAEGFDPALEAAVVKDLGTAFEQRVPNLVQGIATPEMLADEGSGLGRALEYLLQASPAFSLRGGTREILRGIIARGLGLR